MLDSYSAIFALSGFVISQIILGEVMNFRVVVELATLGLAWVGTSLLSSHLQLLVSQEIGRGGRFSKALPKKILMVFASSSASSVFFFLAFLLAQSLSDNSVISRSQVLIVAAIAGLVSAIKYFVHEAKDVKIMTSEKMKSLTDSPFNVDQIFRPFWLSLIILATFFGAFVWTESWSISLLFGFLNIIYFGLLTLQFSSHNFRYILKWKRSILVEPLTMALLSYCLFLYIDKLPLQTSDRSMIFIFSVYIISIIHKILSNLLDITENPKVNQ